VDEENVARLTEAYHRGAALPPIRVRLLTDPRLPLADARYRLIYGHSRCLAAGAADRTTIETEIVTCTDAEAVAIEARENLDRRNLSADQKSHAIAALIEARMAGDDISVPPGPQLGDVGRPEAGISKAARDEGISETAAKRALRIAAITPEAKALCRAELPAIARVDLEEIAAASVERQIDVTRRIIDDRKAGRSRVVAAATVEPAPAATPIVEGTVTEGVAVPARGALDEDAGHPVGDDPLGNGADDQAEDDAVGIGPAGSDGALADAGDPGGATTDATNAVVENPGRTNETDRIERQDCADRAAALVADELINLQDRVELVEALESVAARKAAALFVKALLARVLDASTPEDVAA
jgi:hypothetical protein